jgi:vacuolar protein sorting-associated protein 26
MVFGIGDSGLKIQIVIQPNQQSIANGTIVPMDHRPSWKVGKNPFHSGLNKMALLKQSFDKSNDMKQQQQQGMNQNINNMGGMNMNMQPQMMNNNMNNMQQQQQQYPNQMMQNPMMNNSMQPQMNMNMPPQQQFPNAMNMNMNMQIQDQTIYAYGEHEDVQGVAHLTLPPGKKFEHLGIKIQFVGRVDMSQAIHDGRAHYDFISLTKELHPPGILYQTQTSFPFFFRTDSKPYETYNGRNVHVRYFVRVLVERKFFPAIKQDQEMIVQLLKSEPRLNEAIKMEVGIEECLHIEFQYQKRYYHLNDVIEGNIHFMLVRIKIKYMELAVIRRETSGEGVVNSKPGGIGAGDTGASVSTETQTLTRFEIMDGAPVKGEVIPVRLFLDGIPADLTPTYDAPNTRFAVRYYLNLVLVDEEDRRYFKQQEIILWRKHLG